MESLNTIGLIISSILVATASGLIGSFLVLRRMVLVSDALSHIALPGIALGILFHFQPLLGGLIFLIGGIILIWFIEHKTKLAVESITGVLFVFTLALGAILIPEHELLETFFGDVEKLTFNQMIIQAILALLIILIGLAYQKEIILSTIAPDLAFSVKINRHKIEFILLFLIALTIAIGINFVGVLLISALSIIPAVTSRNIASNLKIFISLSIFLSIISLEGGLIINNLFQNISAGIGTVLISSFFFFLSLII